MDAFQLLAFLVDAVTTVHGQRATVSFGANARATKYSVDIFTDTGAVVSADHADMRVALRDAVIAFDRRTCAYPQPIDGFRLVVAAQHRRRDADMWRRRGSEQTALDLIAQAEKLEAEALDGRAR